MTQKLGVPSKTHKCIRIDNRITKEHILQAQELFGGCWVGIFSEGTLSGEEESSVGMWGYVGIVEGKYDFAYVESYFDLLEEKPLSEEEYDSTPPENTHPDEYIIAGGRKFKKGGVYHKEDYPETDIVKVMSNYSNGMIGIITVSGSSVTCHVSDLKECSWPDADKIELVEEEKPSKFVLTEEHIGKVIKWEHPSAGDIDVYIIKDYGCIEYYNDLGKVIAISEANFVEV